eukprot:COSAG06_NODE_71134_length_187_cov_52.363636_1_plen_40_part_10
MPFFAELEQNATDLRKTGEKRAKNASLFLSSAFPMFVPSL